METTMEVFDGDLKIIYSDTFNVYNNKLVLKKIQGYDIHFLFLNDPQITEKKIDVKGDSGSQKIEVKIYNFGDTLGTGTLKPIPIINLTNSSDKSSKQIFFSLYGKKLNDKTNLISITVSFYLN